MNTLSKRYNEDNTYDLILANPPFKGSINKSETRDDFTDTKKTELLFLELMYSSLTNGGRCAVIVPDGVLFGSSRYRGLGNVVKIKPPVIISNSQVEKVLEVFERVLNKLQDGMVH